MRKHVQAVRARSGQVLAAGLLSAPPEVRVELDRIETLRRNLRRYVSKYTFCCDNSLYFK